MNIPINCNFNEKAENEKKKAIVWKNVALFFVTKTIAFKKEIQRLEKENESLTQELDWAQGCGPNDMGDRYIEM